MATRKQKFLKTKKEVQKTMKDSVLESVSAAVGSVGAGFAFNSARNKIPAKMQRFAGLGVAGIGTGLNVYAKDAKLKAVSHGITAFGTMQAVLDLKPDMQPKIGVNPFTGQTLEGTPEEQAEKEAEKYFTEEEFAQIEKEIEEEDAAEELEGADEDAEESEDDQDFEEEFTDFEDAEEDTAMKLVS